MSINVSFAGDFKSIKDFEEQTVQFIGKLRENPPNPSLKAKSLKSAVDPHVRTAGVTGQYRAILIELRGSRRCYFFLMRISNHDEASTYAAGLRTHSNPVNSVLGFVAGETEGNEADIAAEIESRAQQLAAEKLAKLQAGQEAVAAHDESESMENSEAEAPTSRTETQRGETTTVVMSAVPPRKTPMDAGIDQEALGTQLGISKVSIGATWRARSKDNLEPLLVKSPDQERDAIAGLIAGLTIDEVKEDLGLAPASPTDEAGPGGDGIVT